MYSHKLFAPYASLIHNPLQKCSVCGDDAVVIRCHDCRASSYLCALCDEEVHSAHPLHDREHWNEKFFSFIPATKSPCSVSGDLSDSGTYVHMFICLLS